MLHPNGSKYWRLRYRFANKENMLALGVYPEVSLKEARDKRDSIRKLIRDGINPSDKKKEIKRQQKAQVENSFEAFAREWHASQKAGWTQRHANNVLKRLEADLFPDIGPKSINEIKPIE